MSLSSAANRACSVRSTGLRRIFVLTQYNSESLNRHLSNTYKFDVFSNAFVSVLAAEQTEDSPDWFQGTADAVRQTPESGLVGSDATRLATIRNFFISTFARCTSLESDRTKCARCQPSLPWRYPLCGIGDPGRPPTMRRYT